MKIIDRISEIIQNIKSRRIEKILIKSDDKTVVQALTQEEDNSNLDIQRIVSNMEDPKSMVEVVKNNIKEIIGQDNVRDTFEFLSDENITKIVEENEQKLKEQEKIANAILPIKNNRKKLEYLDKSLSDLTDLEVQRILKSLKPERNRKDQRDIEKQKIQIVGKKIFENIKNMVQHFI